MNRRNLKEINQQRKRFSAIFVRFGIKNGYKGPLETVLLKDIKDLETNQILTDHLWFNLTKGFDKIKLQEADVVEFDARVDSYLKGYRGYREDVYKPIEQDYHLARPTNIKLINRT